MMNIKTSLLEKRKSLFLYFILFLIINVSIIYVSSGTLRVIDIDCQQTSYGKSSVMKIAAFHTLISYPTYSFRNKKLINQSICSITR